MDPKAPYPEQPPPYPGQPGGFAAPGMGGGQLPYPVQPGGVPAYPAQPGGVPAYPAQPGGVPAYPAQPGGVPAYPPMFSQSGPFYQNENFARSPDQYQQQQPQGAYGAFQSGPAGMMGAQQGIASSFRSPNMSGYDSDVEGGSGRAEGIGDSFSDKAIRRSFIKKVYGILSVQLAVTILIIIPFMYHEPLKLYVMRHRWTYWVAFAMTMVCMIAMVCCESVRRKAPTNFIFLGVFTVCEGFMLGSIAAFYDTEAVMIAAGITGAVTLGLTLFAFQTKWDFTTCGGMLCGMLVILCIGGFLMIFLGRNKYAVIGYGCAGAIVFSMYIVYDTQLMMGGTHKYAISPEEYIFASLNIYLDIVNLFLYILTIVGAARSD